MYVDAKVSEVNCAFVFSSSFRTTAVHSPERAAEGPAAWYQRLLHGAGCVCLVRRQVGVVLVASGRGACCVFSASAGAETNRQDHTAVMKINRSGFAWQLSVLYRYTSADSIHTYCRQREKKRAEVSPPSLVGTKPSHGSFLRAAVGSW